MHEIDSDGSVDGLFSSGNSTTGEKATILTAEWLNDIQQNLITLCKNAGQDYQKSRYTDVYNAINKIIDAAKVGVPSVSVTATRDFLSTDAMKTLYCDTTANSIALTLPSEFPFSDGDYLFIANSGTSSNNIIITLDTDETITLADGESTILQSNSVKLTEIGPSKTSSSTIHPGSPCSIKPVYVDETTIQLPSGVCTLNNGEVLELTEALDCVISDAEADTTYFLFVGKDADSNIVYEYSTDITGASLTTITNGVYRAMQTLTDASGDLVDFASYLSAGGGLRVLWKAPVLEYSKSSSTTTTLSGTLTLAVPKGQRLRPIIQLAVYITGTASYYLKDLNDSIYFCQSYGVGSGAQEGFFGNTIESIYTNEGGQIGHKLSGTSPTLKMVMYNHGFIDERTQEEIA